MTNINTTQFLVDSAKAALSDLRRSDSSDRSQALRDLLAAKDDEARTIVVIEWGSALVRKALRVAALSSKDEEVANVFWALRDMVDEDGFLSDEDETVEDNDKDVLQSAMNALSEDADEDEVADFLVANLSAA